MSRKLSIISAGKQYDVDALKKIARGIVKDFNPLFGSVEIEEGYENYEQCLNTDGFIPLYLLKTQLPRYIKNSKKGCDIVLCIFPYNIFGDGFSGEEDVAFISTHPEYVSDSLEKEVFIRRCRKLGDYVLGRSLGLEWHEKPVGGLGCIMDKPPYAGTPVEELTRHLDSMQKKKFCDDCKIKLSL
jgi:hypothetical protein